MTTAQFPGVMCIVVANLLNFWCLSSPVSRQLFPSSVHTAKLCLLPESNFIFESLSLNLYKSFCTLQWKQDSCRMMPSVAPKTPRPSFLCSLPLTYWLTTSHGPGEEKLVSKPASLWFSGDKCAFWHLVLSEASGSSFNLLFGWWARTIWFPLGAELCLWSDD